MNRPLLLVVAVALIDADNRVLIAQRPAHKILGGLSAFPGGKVHDGECPKLRSSASLPEGLGIDVEIPCLAPLTFASYAYDEFHLLMPLYICRKWNGFVQAREAQALTRRSSCALLM